ncbi:MAG: hypothetical protein F9K43_21910 [Bauldia sp.]|nr:MAG: hypothetical protein F9K43_21910 [Bauldia sp.]
MRRSLLAGVSALLLCTPVYAADLIIEAPQDDATASAAGMRGVVEIGALGRSAAEDDGDYESFAGLYGAFDLQADLDGVVLGLDGYGEWLSIEDSDPNVTNGSLVVLGVRLGTRVEDWYFGGFAALGSYPNAENDDMFFGYAAGVQAAVAVEDLLLIGTLGYADAPNDDDPEGFAGWFVEGAAAFALSDDFAVSAMAGYGYSADFDVEDDPGEYVSWGIKGAYRIPGDLNLSLVASYEGIHAFDDDDESNTNHTVRLGISIPFGGSGSALDALRPMASPTAPFRASVSADVM